MADCIVITIVLVLFVLSGRHIYKQIQNGGCCKQCDHCSGCVQNRKKSGKMESANEMQINQGENQKSETRG